jgi:hypothetical protein
MGQSFSLGIVGKRVGNKTATHCEKKLAYYTWSWRLRWVSHVAGMGEMRNAYKILVRKPERKRLLRRPRCKYDSTIFIHILCALE